jgi:hypothetical protein
MTRPLVLLIILMSVSLLFTTKIRESSLLNGRKQNNDK